MPGTFILKPIEANLTHNTDLIGKMNPYCSFIVGNSRIKGQICKKGGKHPHWNDEITIPDTNESQILVELMDKDKISKDDNIGSFLLNLDEIQASGQVSRWYPLYYQNKPAGEILLEGYFQPTGNQFQGDMMGSNYGQQGSLLQSQQGENLLGAGQTTGLTGKTNLTGQNIVEQELVTTTTTTTPIIQEQVFTEPPKIFTEQKQIVEPHTFMKEVDVVETRPSLKEIEVLEPIQVTKDVQFTRAVPVTKQIEVSEPQVVLKEIEVIEPQLVTKTIQVVENVPVIKQVEVVEMKNMVKEVETMEPQNFTKQIEVTEYVPVKKQVEVTNPVTLKKAVEFVEPIITTQTITKEVPQTVIVNEEITKTVGPATVVDISTETHQGLLTQNYNYSQMTEQERLRWSEEQRLLQQQGGYSMANQPHVNLGEKLKTGHSSTYHPSPNF